MKQILYIAVGVLVAIVVVWAIENPDDLRHKTIGYSQEEKDEAWEKYHNAVSESTARLKAATLEPKSNSFA